MDSSKRHWPSMFKSKPCNNQWQHDINSSLISTTTCHKTTLTSSVGGCEERTPEPKPRWNPKPEQIRILESIFNSGMVNPPREEIRRIRSQLQEYGQVGDANVFYWFQNRKSRSKHKQRHLQTTTTTPTPKPQTHNVTSPATTAAPRSSSSSSSDKSSQKSNDKAYTVNVVEGLNSPTGSVNQQPYFQTSSGEFLAEPYFLPINYTTTRQGFCYQPEVLSTNVVVHDQTVGNCSSGLTSINELMNVGGVMNNKKTNGDNDDREKFKEQQQQQHQHQQLGYSTIVTSAAQTTVILPNAYPSVLSTINHIQGVGHEGPEKSTVFINDVAFEVTVGPFNVKEAFGDDAVLMHSSGQPVVTNEWGVTLLPLQYGAFYYLVRMLAPSPIDHRNSIDMI